MIHSLNLLVAWSLALVWLWSAVRAGFGMSKLAELTQPQWDIPAAEIVTPAGKRTPRVSIIVPARNEAATIEPALRSLLELDYPNYEIIVVNDRSTDRTGEIVDAIASDTSARGRVTVVHVRELPPRWLGKTHAMWTAAQRATGDWLLFTDADVHQRPDALRRCLAYAQRERADHVVLLPTVVMESVGERMMIAFFQALFVFAHRPWKVADPKSKDHMGVGAFNFIRRDVYEALGTYERMRLAVVDDMQLGALVKQHGYAQRNVFGRDLVRIRWAHGAFGMVRNLNKNLFAEFRYNVAMSAAAFIGLLALNLPPFLGVIFARGWAWPGYALALACIFGLYVGMSKRSTISPRYILLHPVSTVLMAGAIVNSTVSALWRGGIVWRGTLYPLSELRSSLR